jgi:hypothetical protein
MPDRCDCGCPNTFDAKAAENDLKRYRKEGPAASTKALIDAITKEGVQGATLLDIGGGIGAITLELLNAGAASAESIDATEAYATTARDEAARRGLADRTRVRVGDFVVLAAEFEPADVVTLDKVVCCYPNMPALLGRAGERARRIVGLVYPRDTWWNRVGARVIAVWGWLTRDPTRWHLHPTTQVDAVLRAAGFERRDVSRDLIWQIVLYRRTRAATT